MWSLEGETRCHHHSITATTDYPYPIAILEADKTVAYTRGFELLLFWRPGRATSPAVPARAVLFLLIHRERPELAADHATHNKALHPISSYP
jgi:hypothetical protein